MKLSPRTGRVVLRKLVNFLAKYTRAHTAAPRRLPIRIFSLGRRSVSIHYIVRICECCTLLSFLTYYKAIPVSIHSGAGRFSLFQRTSSRDDKYPEKFHGGGEITIISTVYFSEKMCFYAVSTSDIDTVLKIEKMNIRGMFFLLYHPEFVSASPFSSLSAPPARSKITIRITSSANALHISYAWEKLTLLF